MTQEMGINRKIELHLELLALAVKGKKAALAGNTAECAAIMTQTQQIMRLLDIAEFKDILENGERLLKRAAN